MKNQKTPEEEIETRLERLRETTHSVRPRGDFHARVAMAIAQDTPEPRNRFGDLGLAGRRLFPIAGILAVVSVLLALRSQNAIDDVLATSFDAVEVEW